MDEASAPVGLAAMRVDTDTYRLVYFGFGFEAIDSLEMRREVMSRVLGWLIGAGVQGKVELQGNMEGFGARVYLRCGDTESTTVSQPDGTFIFRQADEGTCQVEVKASAHLSAKMNGVIVQKGEITYLPPVSLQIGDLNGDGEVNAKDLVLVAAVFGESGSEWHGSPTVGGLVTEMVSPEEFGPDFLTIDFDDPSQFQLTPQGPSTQGATFVDDATVTPGFVNQAPGWCPTHIITAQRYDGQPRLPAYQQQYSPYRIVRIGPGKGGHVRRSRLRAYSKAHRL